MGKIQSYPVDTLLTGEELLIASNETTNATVNVQVSSILNYIDNNMETKYILQNNIANNLTTSATGKVLDASQGKILSDAKQDITDAALGTTNKTIVGAINEIITNVWPLVDNYPSVGSVEGSVLTSGDDGTTSFVLPVNNLDEDGSIPRVLDARQGKILNDNKQNKTDNNLTTTNKTIVGAINEIKSNVWPLVDNYPANPGPEGAVLTALDDGTVGCQVPTNNLDYDGDVPQVLDARQGKILNDTKLNITGGTLGDSYTEDKKLSTTERHTDGTANVNYSCVISGGGGTTFRSLRRGDIFHIGSYSYPIAKILSDTDLILDGFIPTIYSNHSYSVTPGTTSLLQNISFTNDTTIDNKFIYNGDILPYLCDSNSGMVGYNLGAASNRWKDIYATNGTIQTSDATLKTAIEPLNENEINASIALSKEIGGFKFLSAVALKGEDARVHIGMTVQKAIEIMEANGLDPYKYAFICKDTIDGQDYYSFRYTELTLFILAGIEHRLQNL